MRVLIAHSQKDEYVPELTLPGMTVDALYVSQKTIEGWLLQSHFTLYDLESVYPAGWKPDVLLFWSLEYQPIPTGLEAADALVVGVVGDWNLGAIAYHSVGGAFDVLFADRKGCDHLRAAGFPTVRYAPLWGFDPALHRRLPDVTRDIDIAFVGNFHFEIQQDRAKWLARLAPLSRRYRLCLTSGVYGEEYVRLLNRARIVFNHSLRGEINMRVYEAAACGALLFYERENEEIRDLFTDRRECVLYDGSNLEPLLDHYLTHEDERARIAEAGWQTVQAHTDGHHLAGVLAQLPTLLKTRSLRPRPFAALSRDERVERLAAHRLGLQRSACLSSADLLYKTLILHTPTAPLLSAHACVFAACLPLTKDPMARTVFCEQARHLAEDAAACDPQSIAPRWIRAHIALDTEMGEKPLAELESLAAELESETTEIALFHVYHPRRFERFDVECERLWAKHLPGSPAWAQAMRRLLLWDVSLVLSDCRYTLGDFADARRHAERAADLLPSAGSTRYRLARALSALGRVEEALTAYTRALRDLPLSPEMWLEQAHLLWVTGQRERLQALVADLTPVFAACPPYGWAQELLHKQMSLPAPAPYWTEAPAEPSVRNLLVFFEPADNENGNPVFLPGNDGETSRSSPFWQSLLTHYLQTFRAEDALNLVLVLSTEDPESLSLSHGEIITQASRCIEAFMTERLRLNWQTTADMTLFSQPVPLHERWRLFREADVLVVETHTPQTRRDALNRSLAEAAGVPICPFSDIVELPALLAQTRRAA